MPELTGTYNFAWEAYPATYWGDQFRISVSEKDEDNSNIYLNLNPVVFKPKEIIEDNGWGRIYKYLAYDTLYWRLRGEGIDQYDNKNLTKTEGEVRVTSDKVTSLTTWCIAKDFKTEGDERVVAELFADKSHTELVSTSSFVIKDTSRSAVVTIDKYDKELVEGKIWTLSGRIANYDSNKTLYAEMQGSISSADFEPNRGLTRIIYPDRNGYFSLGLQPVSWDGLEPTEKFQITLLTRDNNYPNRNEDVIATLDVAILNSSERMQSNPSDPLAAYSGNGTSGFVAQTELDSIEHHYGFNEKLSSEPGYVYPDLIVASKVWTQQIGIRSYFKAALDRPSEYSAPQIDFTKTQQGSIILGSEKSDVLSGKAGWDLIRGGHGNDLIHGGNGRDIISGGLGSDELHGDFGLNTFLNEADGFSDLIAIKSDQFLSNWIYGKAGNNPNGEKADIIEGLDANDQIKIIGVFSPDISVRAGASAHGVSGIGIFAGGALEALYTGTNLSVAQITAMTTGDGSTAAMANQISSYGWTGA